MSALNEEDRANLAAYLDGELDEEASQALEAKLNLDPKARAELDALRQTWGLLDHLPRPTPSASFTNRTMERLSIERIPAATGSLHAGSAWKSLAWAAAILVAAACGFAISTLLWPRSNAQDVLDDVIQKHQRVVENFAVYRHVDDLGFLSALDQPGLFGDEEE